MSRFILLLFLKETLTELTSTSLLFALNMRSFVVLFLYLLYPASEMTYIVSSGALNSTPTMYLKISSFV